ncbi:MAG TPA: PAS domain-containing protein [Rhizomicrobium sp.]
MQEIVLAHHTRMQIGANVFSHPTLTFLHDYWNAKRGDRKMPARKDVSPSDLRQHLGWIFLADVLPDADDFRYRLVGNLVGSYFGLNGTHQTLREVFAPFGRETVEGTLLIYRKVVSGQLPVRVTGQTNWDGKGLEPYETVYLPLSDDGQTANMILSGFVFDKDAVLMNRAIAAEHSAHAV